MSDNSLEHRQVELEWEIEKLTHRGWTNEEIQAVMKKRTSKPRGRPPTPDEDHVRRIITRGEKSRRSASIKIADEIVDRYRKPDSVADRLKIKSRNAEQLDRYRAQIEELASLILILSRTDREEYILRLGHQARLDVAGEVMRQVVPGSEDLDRAKFHLIEARKAGIKCPPSNHTLFVLEEVLRELRRKVGR